MGAATSGAQFSPDRKYRYALWRTWLPDKGHCAWIGLNPSTADETKDDPTVRRCIDFAQTWGFGGIFMLNIFALRSTYPQALECVVDPVGPENDATIKHYASGSGRIIAAWGAFPFAEERGRAVAALLKSLPTYPQLLMGCLGTTRSGAPRHPLYVKGDTQPILWEPKP